MRIVALATGPFAVPTLRSLAARDDVRITALVSRPERQRGSRSIASPAVACAKELGIECVTPPTVNADVSQRQLREWQPDLLFVCDYGEILSAETIACARLGGINLHGSLLPEYRGAAPVAWAILDGRTETGVTVIHMTPRLDAGPILAQASLAIDPKEDAVSLERRLAELGVGAVRKAIELLERWDCKSPLGVPQDPARVTKAPRLRREDGAIDWKRPTQQLVNQVRALQPWPGTYTHCPLDSSDSLRIQILAAHSAELPAAGPPGTLIKDSAGNFIVSTGDGALVIDTVRPENRKAISGAEFLRGYRVRPGAVLTL